MKTKYTATLFMIVLFTASVYGQNAKPQDQWTTFNGNKVRFYDIGPRSKNALVLIHGWTCNAEFWRENYNAFPQYRVIALDLPGHGQSDKPSIEYTMEYFARSVDAVLAATKVKRAVLVGHSMGTPVARQFYKLFPAKTIAIVNVDMALSPFGTHEQMMNFVEPVVANFPDSAVQFIDGMLAPIKDPSLKSFIRSTMLASPKQVAASALRQTFDAKAWTPERIDVPVLATVVNSGLRTPSRDDLAKVAPKVEFQLWTDASHFLMMEQPARFNGQVKSFIVRNKLL